ncbi:MAG: hypothetical protein ACPGTU_06435 [Myxococcota bacterium]
MRSIKAILIFAAYALLLTVGTPGLDFLPTSFLSSKSARTTFTKKYGDTSTSIAKSAGDFNRWRKPIAKKLGSFQPIFRIRQSWHLYRDGPSSIRRMEIYVDDTLIYRTLDSDKDWNEAIFRNRRVRPMAETLVKKPKAVNRLGLGRFIVNHAREDFPDAERIEIRSLSGRRPGSKLRTRHRMVATAPSWKLEDQ